MGEGELERDGDAGTRRRGEREADGSPVVIIIVIQNRKKGRTTGDHD